jgi:hypothetical protein
MPNNTFKRPSLTQAKQSTGIHPVGREVTVPALETFEREMRSRIAAFMPDVEARNEGGLMVAKGN